LLWISYPQFSWSSISRFRDAPDEETQRRALRFFDAVRRIAMRSNSGRGKGNHNRGNPALDEQEQVRGSSGEAITGAKQSRRPADRTPAPSHSRTR
jgi:hypothetical protein